MASCSPANPVLPNIIPDLTSWNASSLIDSILYKSVWVWEQRRNIFTDLPVMWHVAVQPSPPSNNVLHRLYIVWWKKKTTLQYTRKCHLGIPVHWSMSCINSEFESNPVHQSTSCIDSDVVKKVTDYNYTRRWHLIMINSILYKFWVWVQPSSVLLINNVQHKLWCGKIKSMVTDYIIQQYL